MTKDETRRADSRVPQRGLMRRLSVMALLSSASIALLGSGIVALHAAPAVQQLAWVVACAFITLCSLINLRSNRVIGQIESELLRCGSDRRRWQAARPLIGQGRVVDAWNELLGFAEQRSTPVSLPQETDEDAALVLRAYRSFPIAMAVTDESGTILRHNAALSLLLANDAKKSFTYVSLFEALELTVDGELKQRLLSGARTVSIQLPRGSQIEDGIWRVGRTRLEGRPSDAPGSVWWIEDVTQSALATEARDRFLTTATHELRTPLANLRAYAEALVSEQGVDVEQQKEFCNIINDECIRLSRLVDQLLTVDQLEAGSLVLSRGEVDIGRVIREALDHVRSTADAKQQSINVDIHPKLPIIIGDKDKLQAMLVNLLGNAVKYTPDGGQVELIAVAPTQHKIELTVADNGPGISAEELPKIFDKFFRSSDPRITEHSGNGLGLTFAREIARLHGGELNVESRVNEGSRFTASLPAKPAPTSSSP